MLTSIGFQTFITLVNVATCVFTISLVLSKNPHSRLVRLFSIFIGEIGLWSVLYYAWMRSTDPAQGEFLVRTVMIFITIVPASFLHFVTELTRRPFPRWFHVVNYAISFCFAASVYSPAFARYGAGPFLMFPVWPVAGPLFYLHVLHFSLNFLGGHVLMVRVMRAEQEPLALRTQVAAVCWGNLVAVATGSTNFLPWMRADVPIFGHIPPLFTGCIWLFVLVYGWAIVRHQFMDVEVVIKRTLVFAGLVGSVVMMVSLVTFVMQDAAVRFVSVPKIWSHVLAATIIAASYGRVRAWLERITDRYLFQRKYDYKQLLKQFSDDVIVTTDLQKVVQNTVRTLSKTIKPESCSLFLLNKEAHRYDIVASRGVESRSLTLAEHEPLVRLLRATHEPIGTEGELGKVRLPEEVTQRIAQLKARLCLPLQVHDELKGVLCLGKKRSDQKFTKDDLDILLPLSKTLGIAISNAQLFSDLSKTQAEAAQKEKLAVIGTLSAGINHEIRNPLGIIKAQCETFVLDWQEGLLKNVPGQEVVERCLAIMRGALYHIDRATTITQKLSNFAKPIQELEVQSVSVPTEVAEVLTLLRHDLKLEQITIQNDVPSDLPRITADRRQIQEVLFNLIRNAAQAIHPPGTITVRASQLNGRVQIEITDTGAGIPTTHLEKIYDPFFTTKEPGKGTGLGLFIVRQIVERNKGLIAVKSAVGAGTTFSLEFPSVNGNTEAA